MTEEIKKSNSQNISQFFGEVFRNCPVEDISIIARYFLYRESMNHKKLQKLCYYAQSWFLANYGIPLFPNRFEAWVHGPVSPDLYQRYRNWGWMNIPRINDCPNFNDNRVLGILDRVYEFYGNYSADELENITHKEEPWKAARGNCMPQEYSRNPISLIAMRNYYGERIGRKYEE